MVFVGPGAAERARARLWLKRHEPAGVLRAKLLTQRCPKGLDARWRRFFQVPEGRRQQDRLDADAQRPQLEIPRGPLPDGVVVLRDMMIRVSGLMPSAIGISRASVYRAWLAIDGRHQEWRLDQSDREAVRVEPAGLGLDAQAQRMYESTSLEINVVNHSYPFEPGIPIPVS